MYTLTLTADERRAFDWVGNRYNSQEVMDNLTIYIPEGQEWDDRDDITFDIPEHVAWRIRDLAEEEDFSWPCFSKMLKCKMNAFCDSIV